MKTVYFSQCHFLISISETKRNLNYATPGSTTELSPTLSHKLVAHGHGIISMFRHVHICGKRSRHQGAGLFCITGALMLVGLAAIAITTPKYIGRQINLNLLHEVKVSFEFWLTFA